MVDGEVTTDSLELQWVKNRIIDTLRGSGNKGKFAKAFDNEKNMEAITVFIREKNIRVLSVHPDTNESFKATLTSPAVNFRQKALCFLKPRDFIVTSQSIKSVMCMEYTSSALESISYLTQDVMKPLIAASPNRETWSEPASLEILHRLNDFSSCLYVTVGQAKGKTLLPFPPTELYANDTSEKERIHIFEAFVVGWTKQIKAVLKLDPETLMKPGSNPNPMTELKFWESKSYNLNAVHEQLCSIEMKRVLQHLRNFESMISSQFINLSKEVILAKREANENTRFLSTLRKLFTRLNEETEFEKLRTLFAPIMHIMLLIWKTSNTYNTDSRLTVLMREICNALIDQARKFASGEILFGLMENDNVSETVCILKTTIEVCEALKSAYKQYMEKSSIVLPVQRRWEASVDVLFSRLESFLERCHDILEFTKIVLEFTKLEKIYIGGTKGKSLTDTVRQLFADFFKQVATFKAVPYDIMDVNVKDFDDDFYRFRLQVKELERRLSSILTSAFDDCSTIFSRFKLLEGFEGLLERPIIQDELQKKKSLLLQQYAIDLRIVQEIFLDMKLKPPSHKNLPPTAGALSWCRGLIDRITNPILKLRQLMNTNEMEEFKEIENIYESVIRSMYVFQNEKINKWKQEIDGSTQGCLIKSLIKYYEDSHRLYVNFDDEIVRLLREVKYLLSLEIEIPQQALAIYNNSNTYRMQNANLSLIVSMHNEMLCTLTDVERPLVEKNLASINSILKPGVSELNWKSKSVNDFITTSMTAIKKVYDTVTVMKSNLQRIVTMLKEFSKHSLIDRKNKPLLPQDFADNFFKLSKVRHDELTQISFQIEALINETCKVLKVSRGAPTWKSYVQRVQEKVREGLAASILTSLQFVIDNIDHDNISVSDLPPMIEIKLGLYADSVLFNPRDIVSGRFDINLTNKSIWEMVEDWVDSFFEIGRIMVRLDGSGGDYVNDLRTDANVIKRTAIFREHLKYNLHLCENYRADYNAFDTLWKTDRNVMFHEFLINNSTSSSSLSGSHDDNIENQDENSVERDEVNIKGTVAKDNGPPLEKFEERILFFKSMHAKIEEMKTPIEIGWLRINASPIKQALSTWVSKWIHTFTSYMQNTITRKLVNLDTFMDEVANGLDTDIPTNDTDALEKNLSFIHEVRTRNASTLSMFAPLREMVALLKRHGLTLDEYELKLLDSAPLRWENTVDKVYKVKEKITPLQDHGVDSINIKAEEFANVLRRFRSEFRENAPFSYDMQVSEAYKNIGYFHGQIGIVEKAAADLNRLENLFELQVSSYLEIVLSRKENRLLKVLWDMISMVKFLFADWNTTLWDSIDTESLVDQAKKLQKRISTMSKEVRGWRAYQGLQDQVKNMLTVLPLVNLLHNQCMKDRHWTSIMSVSQKQFTMGENFCLANLLELKLHLYVSDVEEIVELATKEDKIDNQLKKIKLGWTDLPLEFVPHSEVDVFVIKSPDEVLVMLEENMAMLQGISGQGRYVEHFIDDVEKWQKDLGTTESVLHDWLDVQSKWSSLQSIFLSSQDIRIQLPEDSKRFDSIDDTFRNLMTEASATPNTIEACTFNGRSELLSSMKEGLEKCEKSLNQYLETKKIAFPRFYFLSNTALLDILSNGNNPQAVQAHLGDCFDNVRFLKFQKDESTGEFTKNAVGMYSKDGDEYVPFVSPFLCEGAVEDWLNGLVNCMRDTLRDILERAKFSADQWEIEKPRHEWLFDYCAQIALAASQVLWTEEVESQFDAHADGNEQALREYLRVLNDRLSKLIQLVLGKLCKSDRIKIITLITVDVHNRDVVQNLINNKVEQMNAFAWQSQLRYKWVSDTKDCKVMVADAHFSYSYEYVGNTGRLVITPLTDRCYITLTQALRLIMGGAPAGPAGTGKTETTKDLGRGMGLAVYVFNCSEQMNVLSLGAIFKGLSQTGAWGCFDEFNRIPIEVLSVVSTQFSTILTAIRERQKLFDFMGEQISLQSTVGVFITMNPGYAGRTELPENLKALFRSCAMVIPDMQLICENMLMSEGFLNARPLALKFITLYSLSKELLSKQSHYDWGLRATKAVLVVAGGLRRAEPNTSEDRILMRALRDFNLPKVVAHDTPIFMRLIVDLFPSIDIIRKSDPNLTEAVATCTRESGLQSEETFMLKVVQLAELLEIRHSVFVIGPAGSAKSECWQTLFRAYNRLGQKCVHEVLNPKAIRNDELYGWLSKTDWNDGVLSNLMRNMCRNNPPYNDSQKWKFVVLDGDIDPEWIESLNTVMDDNKVLTLVSNERIPLTPSMRLLFEIAHLDNATPATVSRAGIIYINERDVGWKPFVDSWIASRDNEQEQSTLLSLFNKYVTAEHLDFLHRSFKTIVPISDITRVQSVCYLLEGILPKFELHRKSANTTCTQADYKEIFEMMFVFACIWALGGALLADKQRNYRNEFSAWWKNTFSSVKFPLSEPHEPRYDVFDYFVDIGCHKLSLWQSIVPVFESPVSEQQVSVNTLLVATPDTQRLTFLVDLLVRCRKAPLFVGTAGTGKTSIVQRYLTSIGEEILASSINLNSYTDAATLQSIMEQSIDKRSGRVFGPSGNKKLIYFVDDLNMPFVDTYGTQTPIALMRQHMDYGTWFDREKLEKKEIRDVQYIACMNPTAGSFVVNCRLMRHFTTLAVMFPSDENLRQIYTSILSDHLTSFKENMTALTGPIVQASILMFQGMVEKFMPTAGNFHYQFNLRDMSNVFSGLVRSRPVATYSEETTIIKLWMHECMRVYGDRLTNEADLSRFEALLKDKVKETFTDTDHQLLENRPLLFTSFVSRTADAVYSPVIDMANLNKALVSSLDEYNETNAVMNLELFSMAMEHVVRITRIIESPRGNALLVGVGGSGKQSLARLAAFICGYDIFQIAVTKNYGVGELKTDLQDLYKRTAIKNAHIMFMLTDSQIVDEKWLVYINDLLSSGYIPDLFLVEDKESIYSSLRNEARAAGVATENREAMSAFFIAKVRSNLHVVLCFSPVGDQFRVRCRRFPGLINCTSINWFHPWTKDALVSVAYRFLGDVDLGSDDLRENIAHHMAEVHVAVNAASSRYLLVQKRYNYTTPKSFLELISFYKLLLRTKRDFLQAQTMRLEKGIATLQKTQMDVAELKEDLVRTLKIVDQKSIRATELIQVMGIERGKVEEQQAIANKEAEKSKDVADRANAIKLDCEGALNQALPVLEEAKEAVNCLDKDSLTVLKSFKAPTPAVVDVTKATYILLTGKKVKKFDWSMAKKMMGSIDTFLRELKALDARNLNEDTIKALDPIIKQENFNAETMQSVSSAAASLCKWIISTTMYNKIYKNVAPKMAAQDKAVAEYNEAMEKLAVVQKNVKDMENELDKVTGKLQEAINEKNQVEEDASTCQKRLSLANRLVDGLADENTRWGIGVSDLQEEMRTIVGDVLLAAAFVSYIGAFDATFRLNLWQQSWLPDLIEKQIPLTNGITPFSVLTNNAIIAGWKNEGLPADSISLENGAIITQCQRWPLLIDPQLQGVKWIRGREKDLSVISLANSRWLNTLVMAVQNGVTVLIENLSEQIDAMLDPLISRAFVKRGRSLFIKLGGEEIPYDESFQLYLQTKLSNPHYKPEVAAQCTLINFIVTESGLEEQLLALVVNNEKPELEEQRTALVRSINEYMVRLNDLENELLQKLSDAPDDILSDVSLIEGLEMTKDAAIEIQNNVALAKQQEIAINKARNEFRTVAAEASWIYFLLIQLDTIDHMYQYSLDAFTGFFFKAMQRAIPTKVQADRVLNLKEKIRITIFTWVSRGVFERHKLIFSSQLCFKLARKGVLSGTNFSQPHFDFLIRGTKKVGDACPLAWLPQSSWNSLQALVTLTGFDHFVKDMVSSPNRFKDWYLKPRPESTPLPLDWRKLDESSPFMKLLIVKCMRPDRMTTAITNFVACAMPNGKQYTEIDNENSFYDVLSSSYGDSNPITPIFFILSAGADPVQTVHQLARKKGMLDTRWQRVAMGQGQDVVAMSKLELGHKEGHWVILENIHLMPSWTHQLEKKLDDFAAEGSHNDFRVFLSAEPNEAIPIGLLERSIKLTNEPPQGLKANLKRAFANFDKEEFDFKDSKVKSILFGLCHFHSIILERKKFGPKGWNVAYPFNTGDLLNSATVLANYLETAGDKVPWEDLRYIFGEIMYGGHITDDWDRLLCSTYLKFYMKEDLFDEMELLPFVNEISEDHFRAPPVMPYDDYFTYIDKELQFESPVLFGLHPNAEIGVKTTEGNELFRRVMELQPHEINGGEGTQSSQSRIETMLESLSENFGEIHFDMTELHTQLTEDNRGPYQNVFLQECDRMNTLVDEMNRSLRELDNGLSGKLTKTARMEVLERALFFNRVPDSWAILAFPSMRSLASWTDNLLLRIAQLQRWVDDPVNVPNVVSLSYFFNPQSFLTAIMQVTAQKNNLELDKLVIATDLTRHEPDAIESASRDGAYVYGLKIEGARWNTKQGMLEDSLPREMYMELPVMNCRAVLADKMEKNGMYACPVYKTQRRGPTYVFTANLRTKQASDKWVLAGVVLTCDIAD